VGIVVSHFLYDGMLSNLYSVRQGLLRKGDGGILPPIWANGTHLPQINNIVTIQLAL